MRVLLIYPLYAQFYRGWIVPPLGLLHIASVLEKNGHEVILLDTNVEDPHFNLHQKIEGLSPDIVGFSSTSMTMAETMEEAKLVKEIYPEVPIVVGGSHATACPQDVLSSPYVDFAVRGEGELTCIGLVECLEREKSFREVLGLSYKENGNIINNPLRPLIPNLDTLPFPSYYLLQNLDRYKNDRARRKPWMPCLTSRGCTNACIFCSVLTAMGRAACWRGHSPSYVVRLFEHLVNDYNVKEVFIQDDSFTADMKRAEQICDELISSGLNEKIHWVALNGVRADRVSKQLLKKMKKAGCYHVSFGIESGNQQILNVNRKGETIERIRNAVTWAKQVGLETSGSFIIGMYGDNEKTVRDTIDFAKSLPLDQASFNLMIPIPGAPLYDIVKENGKFLADPLDPIFYGGGFFELGDSTRELMLRMQKVAYKEFYFRPSYILRQFTHIRSLADVKIYWTGLKQVLGYAKVTQV